MSKKSEAELAKADLIQTLRTIKRLQKNIELRHELNDLEDHAVREFERRLQTGEAYKVDVKALLEGNV